MMDGMVEVNHANKGYGFGRYISHFLRVRPPAAKCSDEELEITLKLIEEMKFYAESRDPEWIDKLNRCAGPITKEISKRAKGSQA